MVTDPKSYHLLSVRTGNVQTVGFGVRDPKDLLLQADDDLDGLAKSRRHLPYWILLFPGLRPTAVRQACNVQRREMFRVCASMDVLERSFSDDLHHPPLDVYKVGYHTIMHDGMASKDERMVVDFCDWCCSGCPDVTKGCGGGCVGTNAVKVVVIGWWL